MKFLFIHGFGGSCLFSSYERCYLYQKNKQHNKSSRPTKNCPVCIWPHLTIQTHYQHFLDTSTPPPPPPNHPATSILTPFSHFSKLEECLHEVDPFGDINVFTYDWRYSLEHFHKRLASTITSLSKATDEIIVLTYGLGGLLFLSFLNTRYYTKNSKRRKSISKWISIGCPFQGTNDYLRAALFGPNPGCRFCKFDEGLISKFSVCFFNLSPSSFQSFLFYSFP